MGEPFVNSWRGQRTTDITDILYNYPSSSSSAPPVWRPRTGVCPGTWPAMSFVRRQGFSSPRKDKKPPKNSSADREHALARAKGVFCYCCSCGHRPNTLTPPCIPPGYHLAVTQELGQHLENLYNAERKATKDAPLPGTYNTVCQALSFITPPPPPPSSKQRRRHRQ